ncbi:MAG: hypothetical protein ACRDGL_01115 [Candidatus Limnocylindrales bacterium]
MRAHDRYRIPVTDGVDVAGWTWGLEAYVDARYRLVASSSFAAALRSAVTNLRRTGLPVPITVRHGDHAWVIVGFTATTDPARTSAFTVTGVRVVGLAYGLQDGGPLPVAQRDPAPDTLVSPARLASLLTAFHDPNVLMAWDGRFVTIQPLPAASPTATPRRPASPAPTRARPTTTASASAATSTADPSAYRAPADLRMVLRGYPPRQGPWPV